MSNSLFSSKKLPYCIGILNYYTYQEAAGCFITNKKFPHVETFVVQASGNYSAGTMKRHQFNFLNVNFRKDRIIGKKQFDS